MDGAVVDALKRRDDLFPMCSPRWQRLSAVNGLMRRS